MAKDFRQSLEKTFPLVKNKRLILLFLVIVFALGVIYSQYIKSIIFLIIFIILGGISKIYHRFFKSSVGIDLVFFTTLMLSMVYKNLFFSLLNAWLGLMIADTLGQRFSYTSLISLAGLTGVALISRLFPFSLVFLVLITVIFEIYSAVLYSLLGSSPGRIILYFASHFTFNMILIFSVAQSLASAMV